MKFRSSIIWWALCVILLVLSSLEIAKIYLIIKNFKNVDHTFSVHTEKIHKKSISEIESTAKLLIPLNSSASNLARVLGSSLEGIEIDFEAIQTKIAPTLFVALSTIPHVSQVSYTGSDGEFYSYYKNEDQTFVLYSNDTSATHAAYIQTVNRDDGKPYGTASPANFTSLVSNSTIFQELLNDHKVYSLLLNVDSSENKQVFVYYAQVDGKGMISVGFPAKVATDYFKDIDFRGGFFLLAAIDGKVILDTRILESENSQFARNKSNELVVKKLKDLAKDFPLDCDLSVRERQKFDEIFGKNKHKPHCSSIDIAGIPSMYVIGFPNEDFDSVVFKKNWIAKALIVLEAVTLAISVSIFIVLILKLESLDGKVVFIQAALIKQWEATQQAEKKNIAFTKTSHDIRASLATITCLIELSQEENLVNSSFAKNLKEMENSAQHLIGILNTVLDTSKLEAGKMTLVDDEFNLVQLIEETVYQYCPVGMAKGVDVIFDACDGSIFTSYHVKGDRLRCKQILSNLLSNAVKFTDEGHVIVRAMVTKPSIESEIISSNGHWVIKTLSKLCFKNYVLFKDMNEIQGQKPGDVELVIEVEDTGKGIPKEKYKSVFEDFVQAEETALGKGGSGLGLGIVQSLVRLMGGEIKIVDKERGTKGTCFKFNIFLKASRNRSNLAHEQGHHSKSNDGFWFDFLQNPVPQSRSPPHKTDGSHVVIAMASEGRRTISKSIIEKVGITVTVVDQEKKLIQLIRDTMVSLTLSNLNSSDNNEICYADDLYISDSMESAKSYDADIKKTSSKVPPSFVLFLIDYSIGSSPRLTSALTNFKKEVPSSICKIVQLENPITGSKNSKDGVLISCDHIVTKPFHGSCLYQVLRILPEFGGVHKLCPQSYEIGDDTKSKGEGISFEVQLKEIVIQKHEDKSPVKPLIGKKALVVDDCLTLQMGTRRRLEILGAAVHVCGNGKEAYDHVCKVLAEGWVKGHIQELPYDYIFMDCEMKVMDGYEATKRIRMEEKKYNIYFPIIALSSHAKASTEGEKRTKSAGMDYYLEKPLKQERLLESLRYVDTSLAD